MNTLKGNVKCSCISHYLSISRYERYIASRIAHLNTYTYINMSMRTIVEVCVRVSVCVCFVDASFTVAVQIKVACVFVCVCVSVFVCEYVVAARNLCACA